MTRVQVRLGYALASVVCLGAFVVALVELYGPGERRNGVVAALVALVAAGAVGIHWFGGQVTRNGEHGRKHCDPAATDRRG